MDRLTPLEVLLRVWGDYMTVAERAGIHRFSAYHWRAGSAHRDPGDIPSPRHIRTLLAAARAEGVALEAEHLVFGMEAAALEALLAGRETRAAA